MIGCDTVTDINLKHIRDVIKENNFTDFTPVYGDDEYLRDDLIKNMLESGNFVLPSIESTTIMRLRDISFEEQEVLAKVTPHTRQDLIIHIIENSEHVYHTFLETLIEESSKYASKFSDYLTDDIVEKLLEDNHTVAVRNKEVLRYLNNNDEFFRKIIVKNQWLVNYYGLEVDYEKILNTIPTVIADHDLMGDAYIDTINTYIFKDFFFLELLKKLDLKSLHKSKFKFKLIEFKDPELMLYILNNKFDSDFKKESIKYFNVNYITEEVADGIIDLLNKGAIDLRYELNILTKIDSKFYSNRNTNIIKASLFRDLK